MGKKLYHVYNDSPELFFRVHEDYILGIDKLALAAYTTNTQILGYDLQSNHFHAIINSSKPVEFCRVFKISYTKSFNYYYNRQGPLGNALEPPVELTNIDHILTAIAYVISNSTHHNISVFPTSYPYSSAKYYFREEIGLYAPNYDIVTSSIEQHSILERLGRSVLSKSEKMPTKYKLDRSGLIVPETFLAIERTESLFRTVRNFIYRLNKLESADFLGKDANLAISDYRLINKSLRTTDIKVCGLINDYLAKYKNGASYTSLTIEEKIQIAKVLIKQYGSNVEQCARCLAINSILLQKQRRDWGVADVGKV